MLLWSVCKSAASIPCIPYVQVTNTLKWHFIIPATFQFFSWVNHSLSVMFIFHLSSDKYKSLLIAKLKKMHTDNSSFFLNCLLIKAVHVLIDQYLWFNRSFWQLGFFVRRCQFSCSVIHSFNYNSTVYR